MLPAPRGVVGENEKLRARNFLLHDLHRVDEVFGRAEVERIAKLVAQVVAPADGHAHGFGFRDLAEQLGVLRPRRRLRRDLLLENGLDVVEVPAAFEAPVRAERAPALRHRIAEVHVPVPGHVDAEARQQGRDETLPLVLVDERLGRILAEDLGEPAPCPGHGELHGERREDRLLEVALPAEIGALLFQIVGDFLVVEIEVPQVLAVGDELELDVVSPPRPLPELAGEGVLEELVAQPAVDLHPDHVSGPIFRRLRGG